MALPTLTNKVVDRGQIVDLESDEVEIHLDVVVLEGNLVENVDLKENFVVVVVAIVVVVVVVVAIVVVVVAIVVVVVVVVVAMLVLLVW